MSEIPKPSIQEVPDKDADIFADMDVLAGEIIASAQPKSPKPDKPRAGGRGNWGKGELNQGEVARLQIEGSQYIADTEKKIDSAQTIGDLMELADRISSKKDPKKEQFSLKLPNGLPALLPMDKVFSEKFNGLIGQWKNRIAEVLFDDAHREYFRSTLRETLKTNPEMAKGDFFSQYLDHFGCLALGDVIPVREKLVALWEEQFPAVMRELKDQKKQQAKFVVGDTYTLRSDSSKEYVITEVSDEKIAYKSVDSGLVSYSTKEKFARFLKKKPRTKSRKPNVSTTTFAGNPGDQPPLPDGVSPEPVVGTVAGSAKEGAETPIRTYEELFKEADADGYHDILFGAAVAGINTMKEGAQKESVDLKTYNIDHPGEILGALIDGMKDSFARVGGKFGWSESETDMYARELVSKSIEKYLK